ncbi:MAG: hypothetical protein OCC49_09170 [Fibrobacterales bacterium]
MIENSILVLLGTLGDLTHKKLFPVLNSFFVQQKFPQNFVLFGGGLSIFSDKSNKETVDHGLVEDHKLMIIPASMDFHYSELKNTYILIVYEKIIDPIIQNVSE